MSGETGAWLQEQRESRGWDRADMAAKLIAAAREQGKSCQTPRDMLNSVYRWEDQGKGISEKYRLLYCAVFKIKPAEFGRQPGPPASGARTPGGDARGSDPLAELEALLGRAAVIARTVREQATAASAEADRARRAEADARAELQRALDAAARERDALLDSCKAQVDALRAIAGAERARAERAEARLEATGQAETGKLAGGNGRKIPGPSNGSLAEGLVQ